MYKIPQNVAKNHKQLWLIILRVIFFFQLYNEILKIKKYIQQIFKYTCILHQT